MRTGNGAADPRALEIARSAAVRLPARPALAVSLIGPDARRFCNGMFTNNARDLPVGSVQRSAMVDDRARIGGFLDLACLADDRFFAVLDGATPEQFLERYEKFVVFEDVALAVRADLTLVSIQGPGAGEALRNAGIVPPPPGRVAADGAWMVVPSRRSPAGGFDVLAPPDDAVLAALAAVPAIDERSAEALRVSAVRPAFPADTGDRRLPHELGLREELLSFDKGCYLGQETINRVDVMGDVKRLLVGVRGGGAAPSTGAELVADGAVVGAVTSPVDTAEGWVALAVVRRPHDAPGTALSVRESDGSRPATVFGRPA